MASIKLKFRTSSVQEKEGRLYYQVIHNRVARQIHTEYRIYSSEWDADHSNIILPTSVTPQRQAYLLSLKDTLDADRKENCCWSLHGWTRKGSHIQQTPSLTTSMREKNYMALSAIRWSFERKTETHRQEADGSKVQNHPQQPPALPEMEAMCQLEGSQMGQRYKAMNSG